MFDYKWFGMSEWEASTLDPQQSMLLHMTWECLHSGGYHPGNPSDDNTGVFIAISGGDAHVMGQSKPPFPPATSFHTSIAANRIARTFNFTGPSMTINTACASSLSALDAAYLYLKAGRCSKALVGSVNTLLDPNLFTILGNMGMTSPNGKCSVFDESANGYVRGEGSGMILLMPLATAQEEDRRILAVIKSTCSADNGSSSATLTAPNSGTQSKLIKKVLANAQIKPENVSYIEAHGTGTNLGDPIEVDALKEVFSAEKKPLTDKGDHIPPIVGSIKANIGHLETGAGIAGLIKTVTVLEHAQATGNAALHKLNPAFADMTDIHIPIEPLVPLSPLKDASSSLLTALVNSFGFGGSVATAVLQQYLPLPHMARVACGVMLDAQQDGTVTPNRVNAIGSVFKANFAAFREADQCWEETIETCILLSDRIKSAMRDGTDLYMSVFRLFYGIVSVLHSLGMEIVVIAGSDLATVTLTQVVTGEMDLTHAIYSLVSQDEMEEETKMEIMESCLKQPLVLSLSLNQSLPWSSSKSEEAPSMRVDYSFAAGLVSATNSSVIIEDLRAKLLELRSMSDKLELESCPNKPSKDVQMPAFYQRYPLRTLVDKAIGDSRDEAKMANKKEEERGKVSPQHLTAKVADLAQMGSKEVGCKFGAYSAEVVDESGYITQAGSTESLGSSATRQSTPIKAHPTATPSFPPASTDDVTNRKDDVINKQSCKEPKQVVLSTLYDQIKEDLDSSDVTLEQFASSGLFELGLDSLNVMQIADFLDQKYKVSKPFSEIIDYDTVGDLAEAVAKESTVLANESKPQAPPTAIQAPPTAIQAPPTSMKSKSSSIQVNFPKVAVRPLPPNYPTLSKDGYYTVPDMSTIQTMTKEQLQSVQDFTVGRKGAGKLVFLGTTDVTGLNIDELLCIEKECVEIIQQSDSRISDRLNKSALLYFEGIFPSDHSVEGLFSFEQSLKAFCKSSTLPMHYSSYDAAKGVLEIKVDKFY